MTTLRGRKQSVLLLRLSRKFLVGEQLSLLEFVDQQRVIQNLNLEKCITILGDRKHEAHFTAAALIFYTIQNTRTSE